MRWALCWSLLHIAFSKQWQHAWRQEGKHLPVDPANVHPSKKMAHRNSRTAGGGTIGLPLAMGWDASRSWDSCTSLSAVDYHPYSTGNFCNNGGKVPFLVEGLFEPGECVSRCTRAHNCAFVTLYRNGWCQLGSKCLQESPAGDSSAMTYAKVVKSVCKDEECWGGWD
ncbi:unnamed protein product [Durusdinium trenchii]|uniref:Apple domain-containing protein n=1 Tax=Durusdinium trenchii TaxID=1381693 RepID=A0ABP0M156_9DINO